MRKILLIIILIMAIFQMVVLAIAIDIGSAAVSGTGGQAKNYTYINLRNPANATGKITSVQIYAYSTDMYNVEVATFYLISGTIFSTRSTQYIGTVTIGGVRTFEVNLDVGIGDYIGIFFNDGSLARIEGTTGYRYEAGDKIPCTEVDFTSSWTYSLSLYGTGTTEEEEANAIFFGTNF